MNAFIIKDGPEIRTYSSPRYAKKLHKGLVIYLNHYKSKHLQEYKDTFQFEQLDIRTYRQGSVRPFFRLVEILFYGVKKRYTMFQGEQEYSHVARKQAKIAKNGFMTVMLYVPLFLLARLYDYMSLKKNLHLSMLERYKQIETLYITAYNKYYMNIVLNIKEMNPGLKVVLILHSEKDILADSYVPMVCDELHLWKVSNLEYLKKTYPFFKNQIKLIGVPRFHALKNYINEHAVTQNGYYTIMYICSHPYIVKDEFKIIQELIGITETMDHDVQWIIRLNPMNQEIKAFEYLCSKGVRISYPNWEWNEEKFFNMPSMQAEEDFFEAMLQSNLFVGGISTVALEACILKKEYLALTFDDMGNNEKLSTLLESSIYAKYIESDQISICRDKEMLHTELMRVIHNTNDDIPFDELNKELLSDEH